jgi:hypothetical protein
MSATPDFSRTAQSIVGRSAAELHRARASLSAPKKLVRQRLAYAKLTVVPLGRVRREDIDPTNIGRQFARM